MGPSTVLHFLSYFMSLVYIPIKHLTDYEMTVRKRKKCSHFIVCLTRDLVICIITVTNSISKHKLPSPITYRHVISLFAIEKSIGYFLHKMGGFLFVLIHGPLISWYMSCAMQNIPPSLFRTLCSVSTTSSSSQIRSL